MRRRSDLHSSSSSLLKLQTEKHLLQQPQDSNQLLASAGRANGRKTLLEQGQDKGCYGIEISMEDALGLGRKRCLALSNAAALKMLMPSRCICSGFCSGFSKGGSGG